MPTCFKCGRQFPTQNLLRRKVKTGEYVKRAYKTKRTETLHTRYGMRIVCPNCALIVDLERRDSELRQVIGSGLMLAVLIALYVWQAIWGN